MFDQAANALAPVRAGSVKAYAVMSKTRWSALPDVPSIDEVGRAGTLRRLLARDVGAEGHAEGDHRQAQRRGGACARGPGRRASGCRTSVTMCCRPISGRPRRSPPITRPRSTSGGRSSAPPGSRRSNGDWHQATGRQHHGEDHADQSENHIQAVLELCPRGDGRGREKAGVLRGPGRRRCGRQGAAAGRFLRASQAGDEEPQERAGRWRCQTLRRHQSDDLHLQSA